MEDFAGRIGLFVEHYLLSFRLLSKVEELTRARDLLEELDRFKTDIINLTSHEFRTPLTVLQGFTHLLVDRFDKLGIDKRKNPWSSCFRPAAASIGWWTKSIPSPS